MLDLAVYDGEGAPGKAYVNDNVMLGRAAWAGSQRYGGGVWSGDTQSTWQDFNQQFRAGLNMVMSGKHTVRLKQPGAGVHARAQYIHRYRCTYPGQCPQRLASS